MFIDGTFNIAYCDEVKTSIKYPKAYDTRDKRVGKRQKEREVLGWFVHEGTIYQQTVKKKGKESRIKNRPNRTQHTN